jgi:hypothetical protein
MISRFSVIAALAFGLSLIPGCGLFYQAGTMAKAHHMADSLQVGETTLEIHREWGEPDLRNVGDDNTEVWSYARRPNSNDVTATLFYTSTKPGDKGEFLDLKFVDNKLVSWGQNEHTMPAKQGAGINYGFGAMGATPLNHY